MARWMPALALARILRRDFAEGGPRAAGESWEIIERLHGRRKLEEVLLELDLILQAEVDASTFGNCLN